MRNSMQRLGGERRCDRYTSDGDMMLFLSLNVTSVWITTDWGLGIVTAVYLWWSLRHPYILNWGLPWRTTLFGLTILFRLALVFFCTPYPNGTCLHSSEIYPSFTERNIFHKSHPNELAFPSHLTQEQISVLTPGLTMCSWPLPWTSKPVSSFFCRQPWRGCFWPLPAPCSQWCCWITADILCNMYVLLGARGEWERRREGVVKRGERGQKHFIIFP